MAVNSAVVQLGSGRSCPFCDWVKSKFDLRLHVAVDSAVMQPGGGRFCPFSDWVKSVRLVCLASEEYHNPGSTRSTGIAQILM